MAEDLLALGAEEAFKCGACLQICEIAAGIVITECCHTFCKPCVTTRFANGTDGVFQCPLIDNGEICGNIILPSTIKESISGEDYFLHLSEYNSIAAKEKEKEEIQEKEKEEIPSGEIEETNGHESNGEDEDDKSSLKGDDKKDDDKEVPGDNQIPFECPICTDICEPKMGVILTECFHKFCKECISVIVENTNNVIIHCPGDSCEKTIPDIEVKHIVSETIWDKFQDAYITITLLRDKDATQCLNQDCDQWFYIDDNYYTNNSFVCPQCKKINCILCKELHDPAVLSCVDYENTMSEPEKRGEEYLENMLETHQAMRCTTCEEVIMKDLGCDFLTCTKCLTELCWVTQGRRWGPGGAGDTSGGCRCGINGKCHPNCGGCH